MKVDGYMKSRNIRKVKGLFLSTFLALLLISGCDGGTGARDTGKAKEAAVQVKIQAESSESFQIEEIPEYSGEPYVVIDSNEPSFTKEEITDESYEFYSELDDLGRCGVAEASVGQDIMPVEERDGIGQVKPSGWHTVKYDGVEGNYLYNRCHLLGYQLTGENANEENLITGTRYMNVDGMLPFENMVADYVKETDGHVMYRVTPIFEGDNLVADGVEIEAYSVEDEGEGISFHVFCYNVQPEIAIDYKTGESELAKDSVSASHDVSKNTTASETYVLNTNTKKFHKKNCSSVQSIREENCEEHTGDREDLVGQGYEPCGRCKP